MSGILVLALRILITICLYAFLAWALYTIWRDLQLSSALLTSQIVPTLTITFLDNEEHDQREYKTSEIIIGRDPSCECILSDETVSAHHARLSYHHKQWWLEDLNSTNGTFLNEEPISTATVIISGDEIRCGRVNFEVTFR
ncbi:MAG: FHA domain-containing protein [Anaerolineales bacterium]